MESIFSYLCTHAHHAHWILFCLLLLAGLNLPISEDITLLGGGAIASTCIPDHALQLYIWIFLGCYLSAWEAYWVGRLLGPKLYHISFFKTIITPHRMNVLQHYYAKFGVLTFIVGRFIPGGIRNALFMSSGLMKMPFHLFILRDGIACLLSSSILFYIGYRFGENWDVILFYFHRYMDGLLVFLLSVGVIGCLYLWYAKHKKPTKFQ